MTDPHNAATTRDDHDDEAAFTIRVQPTHQMMLYLAAMPLNPQQPPITIRMTERQYRQMPGHGESILEHLVVEHQHSEHSVQTYEAAQLNYYLASLRQAYNAENPQPPVRHQPEPCRHAGRTDRKGTKRARQMLRPGHANQAKCHFPLRCSEAACNHLRKYDEEITAERMRSLEGTDQVYALHGRPATMLQMQRRRFRYSDCDGTVS